MTVALLSDVVLRPVRGHHAFEGCVEQIATAIRLGVYPVGSTLPAERELAQRLGVSRATLREAIAALREAGMVRTTRGRGGGTLVSYEPAPPAHHGRSGLAGRREELLDCLVFRRVVEPGAAWTAAADQLPRNDRSLLLAAVDEVESASDPAAHRQADSRLHLAIAGVTSSPRTIAAVTAVQSCLHDMLQAIPVMSVNIEHSNSQHRAIVTAINAGRPTQARRAMEQHCEDTEALLRGLLF